MLLNNSFIVATEKHDMLYGSLPGQTLDVFISSSCSLFLLHSGQTLLSPHMNATALIFLFMYFIDDNNVKLDHLTKSVHFIFTGYAGSKKNDLLMNIPSVLFTVLQEI